MSRLRRLAACLLSLVSVGCSAPFLSPEGMLVFPQQGDTGAVVITPYGPMFRDRADVPQRVVYASPFEPWRNPVGFIAPADGKFRRTSRPTVLMTPGLVVSIRPSDELAPTWGGEVLIRIDVAAPAVQVRPPSAVTIVLDGRGTDTARLVETALAQLGPDDRILVLDATESSLIVPWLPGNHRSLALAAVERRLGRKQENSPPRASFAAPLKNWGDPKRQRKAIVFSDGTCLRAGCFASLGPALAGNASTLVVSTASDAETSVIGQIGARLSASVVADSGLEARTRAIQASFPSPGPIVYRNLALRFEGTPGPSHLLETSGGAVWWDITADRLMLGDVRAGEKRTEVVRLSLPGWTATLPFQLRVAALFDDVRLARGREMEAILELPFDEDIARIAQARCGDVLAYASALAWMNRLQNAFLGPGIQRAGGLYQIARQHQVSLQALARDLGDQASLEQANVLAALLDANPP